MIPLRAGWGKSLLREEKKPFGHDVQGAGRCEGK